MMPLNSTRRLSKRVTSSLVCLSCASRFWIASSFRYTVCCRSATWLRRRDSRTHWNAQSAHKLSAKKISRLDRNFCIMSDGGAWGSLYSRFRVWKRHRENAPFIYLNPGNVKFLTRWPRSLEVPGVPGGAHLDTATAGPRTVPVRSGLAGVKTLELSRVPRPSDVLRAGTARAPVVVSRCALLRGAHLDIASNGGIWRRRAGLRS